MFEKLNERLAKVKNQQHKRRKWKEQLADYEEELQGKQQFSAGLKSKMEETKEDMEKLDEWSFIYLLSVLTGSTDERIREKRHEIAATKLKYDESQHALAQIEDSIQELQKKLHALPDIDREYQTILNEKEQLIEDTHSPLTRQYDELSENVAELQSFLTETSKAIHIGEKADGSLSGAVDELEKAKRWGGVDLFGGKGYAAYKKYNHIDEAKYFIHTAQKEMRFLHKELMDAHQGSSLDDMNVEIPGLLTFADFVFDGFFIDSIVQGEIEDSLKKATAQKMKLKKSFGN